MQDSGSHLRLNIVADEGQILIGKTLGPDRVARDENWDVIDKTEPGLQRATGVKAGRLFGADREIIDHQFRGGVLQFGDDLFAGGFFFQRQERAQRILIAHMRRIAVKDASHLYDCASELDLFGKDFCAIGRRENGLADVKTDFTPVNVKSSNDFDIGRSVRADLPVHQSDASAVGGAVIKIDSLDKRAGAVSDAYDGDSYFSHF